MIPQATEIVKQAIEVMNYHHFTLKTLLKLFVHINDFVYTDDIYLLN